MSQTTTTTSAGVHWDLTPLFADADAARAAVPALIESSTRLPRALPRSRRDPPGGELATALDELAALDNSLSRLASYSGCA